MAYKTILLHVDDSPQWPGRFEVAAKLAADFGAHLRAFACCAAPSCRATCGAPRSPS